MKLGEHDTTLEKIRYAIEERVSPLIANRVRVTTFVEGVASDLILRMESYAYGKNLPKKFITYPTNWKEAFKERWFTKRMLKRWPVQYTKIELSGIVIYPEFVSPLGDEPYTIHITTV